LREKNKSLDNFQFDPSIRVGKTGIPLSQAWQKNAATGCRVGRDSFRMGKVGTHTVAARVRLQ
jgi:hypothetical protein